MLRPGFAGSRVDAEVLDVAAQELGGALETLRGNAPGELVVQFDSAIESLQMVLATIRANDYRFQTPERELAVATQSDEQVTANAQVADFIYSVCGIPVHPLPGALFESVLPPLDDHCGRVDALTEVLADEPGHPVPEPTPIPLQQAWNVNSSELLRHPGPGIKLIADEAVIDLTQPADENPARLAVLEELGYTGVVMRKWKLPSGQILTHFVYGFLSPRAAEAYEKILLRAICQYASASWRADLPLSEGGTTTGIGLQLTKANVGLFEQVSFIRGQYRHIISLGYESPPLSHRQIIRFARMAAGR
jgi:hypothetical protein